MRIGDRIKNIRLAKKLSQGALANRTGLLRTYISRVEGGKTIPHLATVEVFSAGLGVPLYYMFMEDSIDLQNIKMPEKPK